MKECIEKLIALGKIPDDDGMPDDLFRTYDALIQTAAPLTYEEAERLILLFSDDCPDLNDGLMRVIETVDLSDPARYRDLIAKCPQAEYREYLETRFRNYLQKQ